MYDVLSGVCLLASHEVYITLLLVSKFGKILLSLHY